MKKTYDTYEIQGQVFCMLLSIEQDHSGLSNRRYLVIRDWLYDMQKTLFRIFDLEQNKCDTEFIRISRANQLSEEYEKLEDLMYNH